MCVHVKAGEEVNEDFVKSIEKELNGVIVKGSRKLVTSASGLPPPIY